MQWMAEEMPPLFLKEWRELRDLSQEELADKMGTSPAMISHLENNRRRWNATHIHRAAKALSCEVDDLLRSPASAPSLLKVWSQIPEAQRPLALRALRAFIESNGDLNPAQ